jgi:hypothetical protein
VFHPKHDLVSLHEIESRRKGDWVASTIWDMTTREKAHKLLDELPESEIEPVLEFIASRRANGNGDEWGEPEMLPIPQDWGWGRLPSGRPAPNWVAGLDEVRRGH